MSKINASGYILTDINDLIADYKLFVQNNFPGLNVDNSSPMGNFVLQHAFLMDMWQKDTQNVYNSFDLDSAEGLELDKLGKIIGLDRIAFVPTTIVVDITSTGTPYTINQGERFVLNNDESIIFEIASTTIISSSPFSLTLNSVEYKEIDLSVGDHLKPINAIPQITDISITSYIKGVEKESDFKYRTKLKTVVGGNGQSGVQRLNRAILEVDNVVDAIVFDINNDITVPLGHVKCIVLGGDDNEVASGILDALDMGILTDGTTTISTPDYLGNPIDIKFSRPTTLTATFSLDVSLITGITIEQRQAIVDAFEDLCNETKIGGTLYYQDFYGSIVDIISGTARIETLTINGVSDDLVATSTEKIEADATIDPTINIQVV